MTFWAKVIGLTFVFYIAAHFAAQFIGISFERSMGYYALSLIAYHTVRK